MKKIVLILLFFIVGCSHQEYSTNLFYMDTVINVKIYDNNQKKVKEAFEGVEKIYQKYQYLCDYYDENSQLYQFNHGYKNISNELKELIDFGLDWYNKSNELLNINIGGITSIWHNFRKDVISFPTFDLLNKVDINVYPDFYNSNNINVDLGSIAKGYVTELAGRYLEDMGLTYYIINAGGNVKVGNSHKGEYKMGITSPLKTKETFYVLNAANISVVTSGSYERFYEYDGELYHHIIDPKTKMPANYVKSVTIIGPDSGVCDALSTTLFLMNVEDGMKYIKNNNFDVDVIWFTNDDHIIKSEGFKYE